jgi:hypothetical protein
MRALRQKMFHPALLIGLISKEGRDEWQSKTVVLGKPPFAMSFVVGIFIGDDAVAGQVPQHATVLESW